MILPQLFWKLALPPPHDQRAIVIPDPRHGDRGIVRHAIRGQTGRGDFGAAIIGIVKRDIETGVLEAARIGRKCSCRGNDQRRRNEKTLHQHPPKLRK